MEIFLGALAFGVTTIKETYIVNLFGMYGVDDLRNIEIMNGCELENVPIAESLINAKATECIYEMMTDLL